MPLYNLLKTDSFKFGDAELKAFEELKSAVQNSIILSLANFDDQFTLEVNAYIDTVSAVLRQKSGIIVCASKRITGAFLHYSAMERECKAIVFGVSYFEHYLSDEFIIKSDHKALVWLMSIKNPKGMIARI